MMIHWLSFMNNIYNTTIQNDMVKIKMGQSVKQFIGFNTK